jgi:hypothetical protein
MAFTATCNRIDHMFRASAVIISVIIGFDVAMADVACRFEHTPPAVLCNSPGDSKPVFSFQLDTKTNVMEWLFNYRPVSAGEVAAYIEPESLRRDIEQFRLGLEKFRRRAEAVREDEPSNFDLYLQLLLTYRTGMSAYNSAIARPIAQRREYSCKFDDSNPAIFCIDIPGGSKVFIFVINMDKKYLDSILLANEDFSTYSSPDRERFRLQLEKFNVEIEKLRLKAEEERPNNSDLYKQILYTYRSSFALYQQTFNKVFPPYSRFR